MKSNFLLLSLVTLLVGQDVRAQKDTTLTSVKIYPVQYYPGETDSIAYSKPKPFRFVTGVPASFAESARLTFTKKSILPVSLIAASTLLLLPFDQDITNSINQFSNYIHLSPDRNYKTLFGFDLGSTTVKPYEVPQNINSVLYTLGEGSTSVILTGGFFVYGKIKKDYRASQTASDIMQAQLAVGVITQLLKRVSGRESPFSSTAAGGVWRPFTHPAVYQKQVSHYDAFPSGHLASMMATVTVVALHYPEKKWIRPVGYSLMTLVSAAMINNGVHWASDYPLALGIGYVFGKATVSLNRALQQ